MNRKAFLELALVAPLTASFVVVGTRYKPFGYLHVTMPEAFDVEAVHINGAPCGYCVEADDAQGWARVLVKGSDGKFVFNEAIGRAETELVYGDIRFIWRPKAVEG